MTEKKKPQVKKNLTLREKLWLETFFETFNASAAARKAYNCKSTESSWKMGSKMFKKLRENINAWLEEQHLTDTALKLKLAELLDAKEKKRFFYEGEIIESKEYPAWLPRTKALELAMKAKGILKERVELSGRVATVNQYSEEELKAAKEAARFIAQQERKRINRRLKK